MHTQPRNRREYAISASILAAALASCGSDDGATTTTTTTTATTTATAPGTPSIASIATGNTFLTISVSAPASNGGAAITSYDATCTGGGATFNGSSGSTTITVSDLTNDTEYSCTVTATNSAGTSDASDAAAGTPSAATSGSLPAEFTQFGANVTVVYNQAAGTVTLEAAGRPDHVSPYWDPNGSSGLYVDPGPETTVSQMSPGFIDEYTNRYFLTVSTSPQRATTSTSTSLGAIGIMITGSPIFNGQEGPNRALDSGVISGFDNYGAHTGPETYHYHLEPTPISNADSNLIGVMADGFFLYGRHDWNTGAPPLDLDASGGHVGPTQFNSEPHYHYHIVDEIYSTVNDKDDYLLFNGEYQGSPAAITN